MVEGLAESANFSELTFSTPPPTLRQLFLIVSEMLSWIKLSQDEKNLVLLHQSDLHTSNPTLIAACLVAVLHRELFISGAMETLPFIAALGSSYPYTKMSISQMRYLSYFNQVFLRDFAPLSKSLKLSKILIVFDEPDVQSPAKISSNGRQTEGSSEDEDSNVAPAHEVIDYDELSKQLFFRVYEGTVQEEVLLFDQLDINSRAPQMQIGSAIVSVNVVVQSDF